MTKWQLKAIRDMQCLEEGHSDWETANTKVLRWVHAWYDRKTAKTLLEGEAEEESNRNYGWRATGEQMVKDLGRTLAFILREMKPSKVVRRVWSDLKLDLNRDILANVWGFDFKIARVERGKWVKRRVTVHPVCPQQSWARRLNTIINASPFWVFKVSQSG